MKSFLLATISLAAFAAANPTSSLSSSSGVYVQYLRRGGVQCRNNCARQIRNPSNINDCTIVDCPPAVRNGCQIPDCSLPGNIHRLHPHPDPNFFYQCQRTDDFGSAQAVVMPCACRTVFSARVDERRCVHPWEWLPDCPQQPARWQDIILSDAQCRPDCEECGDGGNTPPPPVGTQPPPVQPPPSQPPNGCICCIPCVWWPCTPCPPTCDCNNSNNNNRNPTNPWQPRPQPQPQPEPIDNWRPQPPQWQPQPETRDPWQPRPRPQPQPEPRDPWQPEPRDPWQPQPPQWQQPIQRFSVDEAELSETAAETEEVEKAEVQAENEN